jgi:hypothetical protein
MSFVSVLQGAGAQQKHRPQTPSVPIQLQNALTERRTAILNAQTLEECVASSRQAGPSVNAQTSPLAQETHAKELRRERELKEQRRKRAEDKKKTQKAIRFSHFAAWMRVRNLSTVDFCQNMRI